MKRSSILIAVLFAAVLATASQTSQHHVPAAHEPAHSVSAPQTHAAQSVEPARHVPAQARPRPTADRVITTAAGLRSSPPQALGWLVISACAIALIMSAATVVVTARSLAR